MPPGWTLRYLYVGTSDVDADLKRWRDAAGAKLVWDIRDNGDRVAALDVGPGPKVLLANHRPAPSVLPVYAVEDVEATVRGLRDRSWAPHHGPFEVPDGTCYVFRDASGNEVALLEVTRPDVFAEFAGSGD